MFLLAYADDVLVAEEEEGMRAMMYEKVFGKERFGIKCGEVIMEK